ncbi:MAG TPA: hypothetical protein VKZ53_22730 [Candidatus Angelobacter sp.]|nr:hypothetical protein [Candidatus Angelobacter sp.]
MPLRKISLLVFFLLLAPFVVLQAQVIQKIRPIVPLGTGQLESPSQATGDFNSPNAKGLEIKPELELEKPVLGGLAGTRHHFATPVVNGLPVVGPAAGDSGFDGLDHADQRLADSGNQFTGEPPDQAMGVNSTQVFEGVNDAFAVYDRSGNLLAGPTSANKFFGLPSAFTRPAGPFGPDLTDPRIIFDQDTQRWFVTMLEIDVNPVTGAFLPGSHILIGVSTTSDATAPFMFFAITVTDTGFGLCPCLGDQPLLAANADAIFISTNQFSFTDGFQTALILTTDKHRLAAGIPGPLVGIQGLTQAEGPGFSVHPAMNTNIASSNINGGTEYFLSTLNFTRTADDRVTVWSLTNTSSLRTNSPLLNLTNVVIKTEIYGQSPNASQKAGPTPLGTSLSSPEELLATNDDRMQEVYFSQGKLFGAVNTLILGSGAPRAGIAWFEIQPSNTIFPLKANVVHQGYIAVKNENVMFPSIAINSEGEGVMGFTLSGPDFFPGFAYVNMSTGGAGTAVHLVAPGFAPEDGFSGYPAFGGNGVARWGDYGFAAVDLTSDDIWVAGEYIPNRPRTSGANWGTWIEKVQR